MSDEANDATAPHTGANKAKGAIALVSIGAVACGVCCALPFAMPAVALAGAGGALAWLGGAQAILLVVAVVLVLSAWLWIGLRSALSKRRPARATVIALSIATAVLVGGIALQAEALLC